MKSGFLIINKPKNWSSFKVIAELRKITGVKKIGHAGTLDPLATGVLICGVGREATKKLDKFHILPKEYEATIRLDGISSTYDAKGDIQVLKIFKRPTKSQIFKIIQKHFIGEIKQRPPIFSAKKIHGKPAYKWAIKGCKVRLRKVIVNIRNFEIMDYKWPYLKVKIECSSGTYIRSLANDLGKKLKIGGYLTKLNRLSIGKFRQEDALKMNKITIKNWKNNLIEIDI